MLAPAVLPAAKWSGIRHSGWAAASRLGSPLFAAVFLSYWPSNNPQLPEGPGFFSSSLFETRASTKRTAHGNEKSGILGVHTSVQGILPVAIIYTWWLP